MAELMKDIGERGTYSGAFSELLQWENLAPNPLILEEVVGMNILSSGDSDVTITDNLDFTATLSGEYTITQFDQLEHIFRDPETKEDITQYGWPPTDPRSARMHTFKLDPRSGKEISYQITFTIKETVIDSSPLEVSFREDTISFVIFVRNLTGEYMGQLLNDYLNN